VASLGGTVDDATQDGDGDRNPQPRYMRLGRLDGRHHVVLEPAAGRTRDEGRALDPERERLQDLVRDADLLARVGRRQRYADGVADSLAEKDAHAHRAAYAAGLDGT